MNRIFSIATAFIFTLSVAAQSELQPLFCGFDYLVKMKETNDPHWHRGYENILKQWQLQKNNRGGSGGVYVVPVVFHIVYNTDDQNIADSVIYSQMEVLNEDYRRMNEDAINTRDEFLPVAADTEIEFQLADIDPQGNPTTGITHTYTERSGFSLELFSIENTLDEVKHASTQGVDAWDTEHYLNIWVCNIEPTFFGQIFGLSYPPANLNNWPANSGAPDPGDEGVVIHYTTVGRNNPTANDDNFSENNLGRTLTHEIGHYLGLRHTWGDEIFANPCSEDDGISDTPLCGAGDQYQCNYAANTCDEGPGDLPDQLENFMDYTKDACYNMFTNEQKDFMRFVLENPRSGLLNSYALTVINKKQEEISIFPVPADRTVHVNGLKKNTTYEYILTDMAGRRIKQEALYNPTIDIAELQMGNYLLTLKESDTITTIRICKQ